MPGNTEVTSTRTAILPSDTSHLVNTAEPGDSVVSSGIAALYTYMSMVNDLSQSKFDQMSTNAQRARESQEMANLVDAAKSTLELKDTAPLDQSVIEYMRSHRIAIKQTGSGQSGATTQSIDEYLKSIDKAQDELPQKPEGYIPNCKAGDGYTDAKWAEKASVSELEDRLKRVSQFPSQNLGGGIGIDIAGLMIKDKNKAQSFIYDKKIKEAGLDIGQLSVIKTALESDSSRYADVSSQSNLLVQKYLQSYSVTVNQISSMQDLLNQMLKKIVDNMR